VYDAGRCLSITHHYFRSDLVHLGANWVVLGLPQLCNHPAWCGGTAELEGGEPIITLRCTSRGFPKAIHGKEQFWLKEHRNWVKRYDITRLWGSTQLRWSTRSLRKSEWDQNLGEIECVICCMIRWYEMRWHDKMHAIYPRVSRIYTPHHSVLLRYLCISVHPPSPSPCPSSLNLRTPAVAQSSATLRGSGGEKRIFLQQLLPGPLCDAHISSSIRYNLIPKPKRTSEYHKPKGKTQT